MRIGLVRTFSVLAVTLSLLLGCNTTPSIDALDAVSQACATTQELDYDIHMTSSVPGQSVTNNIQVSANDAYQLTGHLMIDAGSGMEPESATYELIEVDGVVYSREEGQEWTFSDDIPPGLFIDPFDLCPDVTSETVEKAGSEEINSIPTTRYIRRESTPGSKDGATTILPVNTTTEYWVDSSGQLVRTRVVQVVGPEPGAEPGSAAAETVRGEATFVISGVGEPNVITAPRVP